ncbi:MAG: LPS export ABC transporter periplasmic protein LptC [Candidatus Xenobia bacterium]
MEGRVAVNSTPTTPPPPPSPVAAVSSASPSPLMSPPALPPQTVNLNKSVLRGKLGGGQSWELDATDIKYDDKNKVAVANDIDCTFFGKGGQQVKMQAKAANVDMQNQDVTFVGPVVAHASTGEVLSITHLRWDGTKRKFFGTDGIKVTRGKSWLVGKEMIGDAALQRLEIKGNVQVYLDDIKDATLGAKRH